MMDYLPLSITLQNTGFSAPFNPRKVYVVLRNSTDGNEIKLPLKTDIRYWFGSSTFTLNENIRLPENTPTGEYSMYLFFPDEAPSLASNPAYAIQLANTQIWEANTGYNSLNHVIQIQNESVSQITKKTFEIAVYPNPANQTLTVKAADCNSYQIMVYNAQEIKQNVEFETEKNELKISTEKLPNGLYYLVFTKNGKSDTRKFVVKH